MQEVHLKLRDKQLKTILYIYRLLHQNLMVTANQKATIDTNTKKIKESKHNAKDNQITREEKRKGRKKTNPKKPKTIKKMAIRTYILIITLKVNGLRGLPWWRGG